MKIHPLFENVVVPWDEKGDYRQEGREDYIKWREAGKPVCEEEPDTVAKPCVGWKMFREGYVLGLQDDLVNKDAEIGRLKALVDVSQRKTREHRLRAEELEAGQEATKQQLRNARLRFEGGKFVYEAKSDGGWIQPSTMEMEIDRLTENVKELEAKLAEYDADTKAVARTVLDAADNAMKSRENAIRNAALEEAAMAIESVPAGTFTSTIRDATTARIRGLKK